MTTPITPRPAPSPAPIPRPLAAPPTPASPSKPQSRLAQVRCGKLALPPRMIVYGQESVGKTTLAANAGALFADLEGGSGELAVPRYPFNPGELDEFRPRTYEQVLEMVEDLIANPGHGHPALAIDTADALEALIHASLCKKYKVDSIEKVGGGFNKGYKIAVEELRRLLERLDRVRAQGVVIIMVAHARVSTFKNPNGPDYDRFSLKVYDGKDASFAGQLKEWCEIVAFLHYEGGAKKEGDEKRPRGWSTNRRIVQLAHDAAWDAKWRLTVPMEMEFELDHGAPWAPFADAIARARVSSTAGPTTQDQILIELNRIAVDEFVTAAGTKTSRKQIIDLIPVASSSGLARILAGLKATPTPKQEQ